jgi:O-antigen/teichoic acid export membrane protein
VPFSYGTTVLLARIGPEAIGTFGVLSVYIAVVSTVLYLGGSAVAIKFVPELDESKRVSFLASYFLVVCAAALPYLVAASLWPDKLRYLFGNSAGSPFAVLVLWLSPIYMLYALSLAALNGLLEIKSAKVLERLVTVLSFLIYATLFLTARHFLARHYTGLIWGIYLSLIATSAGLALRRFRHLSPGTHSSPQLRFFLPRGFWHYTLGLQASSLLGLVSGRLDYVFLLNAGGLALLGKYVALMTIVSAGPRVAAFILDSLFPSVSNTLARGDFKASGQLAETYVRMIVPVSLGVACAVSLLAGPITRVLGPAYESLAPLTRIAAPFATLVALNWLLDTILNAAGHSQPVALAKFMRIVVFVISFWPLWSRFHLLGAVLAWILTNIIHQLTVLFFLRWRTNFRFPLSSTYRSFGLALLTLVVAGGVPEMVPRIVPVVLWLAAMPMFLFLAGYKVGEIRNLVCLVLPVRTH